MKIYLAARYSRNDEMRGVRDVLEALGHKVTSRWIDQHGGNLPESIVAEKLNAEPAQCEHYAFVDIDDLKAADVVISFTSADGGGKGGRHVEYGLALGLGKRLVIVGPRENVFHTLPQVEWYPDWSRLVMAWTRVKPCGCDSSHRCLDCATDDEVPAVRALTEIAGHVRSEIES